MYQYRKDSEDSVHVYRMLMLMCKLGIFYSISRGGSYSTDLHESFDFTTMSEYLVNPDLYDAEWRWMDDMKVTKKLP
jgi:hypothetical protein